MDIEHYMKIQNAYKTTSKKDKELVKTNRAFAKHFNDTYNTEGVLINGEPKELMIEKDTDSNTFKKKIKATHEEPFNLGDYIERNGQIWIVTLLDTDDKTWHRGYMYLCGGSIHWQNKDGKIIERWAYIEDFTKYSSGISSNNTTTVGDNQYGLTLPIDNETKQLRRDMRFVIDFDDVEQPEVYKLTNRKVMINNNTSFGRGGTMIATMSFDTFSEAKDKRVDIGDGRYVWVCDYTPQTTSDETIESVGTAVAIVGNDNLELGFEYTCSATVLDAGGELTLWTDDLRWNIVCDFAINTKFEGNKVKLFTEDESTMDKSIIIEVIYHDSVVATKSILVASAF